MGRAGRKEAAVEFCNLAAVFAESRLKLFVELCGQCFLLLGCCPGAVLARVPTGGTGRLAGKEGAVGFYS